MTKNLSARIRHQLVLLVMGLFLAGAAHAASPYALAREIGLIRYLGESEKHLAALAAARGDHPLAYPFSVRAAERLNEATAKKSGERMVELAERYQAESRQREIDELNRRNEQQAAELQHRALQQRWLWTVLAASLILLAGTAYFLHRLRRSNRLLEVLNTQVRRSQNKLQATLDAIPDSLFVLGLDGRNHEYHSPRTDLLPAPADALLGKTVSDFLPAEAADAWMSALREAHENGVSSGAQYELQLPHGKFWFELFVARKTVGQGEEPRFIVLSRDITERKAHIQELQRWRDIFEHAEWGVVISSADGRTLELMNPAFARMHGYTVEELTGRPIVDVFTPQARETLAEQIEMAHQQGHHAFESMHQRKDGTAFPVLVDVTTVRGTGGDVLNRIVNVQDLTERKQAEREITLLNRAVNASSESMFLMNEQGRFVYVNDASCDSLGYSREELLAMMTSDFDPYFTPEEHKKLLGELFEFGPIYGLLESQHRMRDGRIFPVEVSGTVIEYEGEKFALLTARDITGRKLSEQALRVSEEKYRTLIQKIQVGVVVHGADTRIITSNPVAQEILDFSEDQLLGKATSDLTWHFFREDGRLATLDECPVNRVMATREPLRNYVFGVHRPGRENDVWVLVNADPVFDEARALTQVIVTFVDITQRKHAEEALAAREREFRTLAENIPDHIIRYDGNARKIYINSATVRLMGVEPGALLGQTPEETHGDARTMKIDELAIRLRLVLATGEPQEMEVTLHHAEKGTQIHNVRCVAEYDEQGKIVGALMVSRDITERKRMEEELVYREHKYRTLAENSPSIIVRYDLDCRRVYVNPAYVRETGITIDDAFNVVPDIQWGASMDISAQEYRAMLKRVMATRMPAETFIAWRHPKTGLITDYAVQVVAEQGPEGNVLGALMLGHNVTALKGAERRLEESHVQLRGLAARVETVREEERKRIARDMHDELGQYLTALRMGVSVLRMQSGGNAPAILEQARSLSALVDKTIQVTREMAASLRPAPLDLGVVSALEWLVEEFSRNTGVPCKLDTAEDEIGLDDTHSTAIFRMVQESLTNVARHADASQVEIRFHRHGDDYLLNVSDNGKGFDLSAPSAKSFGLVGLRERALMLGGEVAISSAPDHGTTVRVRIPVTATE